MARRRGKTTQIIEQVNWCGMFDILPVCILVHNQSMSAPFYSHFGHRDNFTVNEYSKLLIVPCGFHDSNEINRNIEIIRKMQPKRIYIDEVQYFSKEFINILQYHYDDIIYAYGTPADRMMPSGVGLTKYWEFSNEM